MKNIYVLLVCLLLLQNCALAADINDNKIISSKMEETTFVLTSLDIMIPNEDGQLNLDKTITRAEFAAMLTRILGIDNLSYSGGTKFKDVSSVHWAAPYIGLAADMGYIAGYEDGTFRPDKEISSIEITKILVHALGYQVAAEQNGGYPLGYESVAMGLGLKENVSVSMDAPILRGDAAMLVYNALFADRMSQTSSKEYEIKKGNTLFKERLEKLRLYYLEGVVNTAFGVSLTGMDKVSNDKIGIEDKLYEAGSTLHLPSVSDLLGRRVRFFADENEVIKSIQSKPKYNETITVAASDIAYTDLTRITYYTDSEQNDKETIDLHGDYIVLYNEKVTDERGSGIFDITNGSITALDNNNDGAYEVIFIYNYDSFIVERVNYEDGIIFIKDKLVNQRPYIKIETNDKSYMSLITDMEGNILRLEDIKGNDSITVSQSKDAKRVTITVVNETITGKVTEVHSDDNILVLDGTKYTVADSIDGRSALDYSEIYLGTQMSFYLDKYNNIFAINTDETLTEEYAYLIEYDVPAALGGVTRLKLLFGGKFEVVEDETVDPNSDDRFYKEVVNSDIVIMDCAEKIKVNGQSHYSRNIDNITITDANGIKKSGLANTVVSIKTNAQKQVTEIKNALPHGNRGERSYHNATSTFGGSNGGAFFINDKTVIFNIPTDLSDEDNFFAKVELRDSDKLEIQGYNCSAETKFADVAVIHAEIFYNSFPSITIENTPISVVKSVTRKLNSDDEPVYQIQGYKNGKLFEKECRNSAYMEYKVKNLKAGDVVRISEDQAGRIADLRIEETLSTVPQYYHEDIRGEKEQVFGSILGIELNTLEDTSTTRVDIIKISSGESDSRQFAVPDVYNRPACYLFDTAKKTVKPISISEVNSVENTDSENANQAYVFASYNKVQVIVVVK